VKGRDEGRKGGRGERKNNSWEGQVKGAGAYTWYVEIIPQQDETKKQKRTKGVVWEKLQ